MDRTQEQRIQDFERRANFAPKDVMRHRQAAWRYIPIHPFADETRRLQELNVKPADCSGVDAYWRAETDVFFVEVAVAKTNHWERSAGYYARYSERGGVNLQAYISESRVTRARFECILSQFHTLIYDAPEQFYATLDKKLRLLAQETLH